MSTLKRDKWLFRFFIFNSVLFFTAPLAFHLGGDWGALSTARLYYRGLTGVGYRYNMFAPEISSTKYHARFIVYHKNGTQSFELKRVVPQVHRARFEHELGIGGGTFHGPPDQSSLLKKLVEAKFLSKGIAKVRVEVVEYEFEPLYSKKPLRKEKVLWSKDYDG